MLTALTKTGIKISLGYDYRKETLLSLRNQEEFVCPVCGEKVLLKLGDHRIFHFAHKQGSQCHENYENETFEHLDGKRQLFQWLLKQKIPAVLEYYDRNIQQRPDIMFQYHGNKYSLEFQCSSLPEEIFSKRTRAYLENGYIPLWVMSSKNLQLKRKDLATLSNFHYSFLRSTSSGRLYIPAFCPETHHIQLVESIHSFTIKNSFAHFSSLPLQNLELVSLLEPKYDHPVSITCWNRELERFIFNWTLHPQPSNKAFLQEIYNHGLNLFLLPPEIGLPVSYSVLIQTPPFIWQTYLFFDVIANKNLNDLIPLSEVNASFQKRIYKKQIIIRKLPQVEHIKPISALLEYLQLLEKIGILTRRGDTSFQVSKKIQIPKSNREREEAKLKFLTQFGSVLSKS